METNHVWDGAARGDRISLSSPHVFGEATFSRSVPDIGDTERPTASVPAPVARSPFTSHNSSQAYSVTSRGRLPKRPSVARLLASRAPTEPTRTPPKNLPLLSRLKGVRVGTEKEKEGRARKKDCLCVYDFSVVLCSSSVSPADPFDVCHKRGQRSRCTPSSSLPSTAPIIGCLLSALVYIIQALQRRMWRRMMMRRRRIGSE